MEDKFNINIKIILIAFALFDVSVVVADDIAPIDCMIEPNVFVELSSSVPGVLGSLSVDKSDEVKKNQIIATLNSDIEQVQVKSSKQRLKYSRSEHGRLSELYASSVITQSEKDQSDNDIKLAELDLNHSQTNLALRQIRSPIDGIVVKRYYTSGEYVTNKPIVKLAQLHPLRVEVVSPVENYGKIIKGMRARIQPDFGDYTDLIAEVVVVDKVIDAASGTFGIRLELDNKDHAIPGGLKCKVHFMLDSAIVEDNSASYTARSAQIDNTLIDEMLPGEEKRFSENASSDQTLMCVSIGPYRNQQEIDYIVSVLGDDIKQKNLRSTKKPISNFLVMTDVIPGFQESESLLQVMKAAGFSDTAILSRSGQYHIAAGIYDRKSIATQRVCVLREKGFDVSIVRRVLPAIRYWADFAYVSGNSFKIANLVPEKQREICDEASSLSLLKLEQK